MKLQGGNLIGRLRRHRGRIVAGTVGVCVLGLLVFLVLHTGSGPVRKILPVQVVTLIRPPQPPPPPPPPPPKIVTPPKMVLPNPQPVSPVIKPSPEKSVSKPLTPEAATAKASGPPDSFNLAGSANGSGLLNGGGDGGGFGDYGALVQAQIQQALQADPKTRRMAANFMIDIWEDPSGHVIRAAMLRSTGDAALDAEIVSQVLPGVTIPQPPPANLPMPIIIHANAVRPD